ncbi:MAG TPA: hypothetical protein VIJ55_15020 [Acetobacteraceae bacterium]
MREPVKRADPWAAMILAVLALLSCGVLPAAAQRPTQAQQNAIRQSCRADYQSDCASVSPGGAAALECLQQHAANLSPSCGAAVAAVGAPPTGAASGAAVAPAAPPPAGYAPPAMSRRQEMAVLRGACGADYHRVCPGVRPGGGRALQCLRDNFQSLSGGCRRVLSHAAPR